VCCGVGLRAGQETRRSQQSYCWPRKAQGESNERFGTEVLVA